MSKQTLATKYRPKTFNDVVEQTPIKMTLQEQLKTDTIKNCYLFTGGAGTGKTTDARIFANEINKGIGSPIEMDAASNNSVEDVRKIIEDAKYKSMTGEYKVYIIDECFPANTLVSTENGDKPISEIKIGDRVQSMTGINTVTKIYKTQVSTNRLCCVHIDDKSIVTTKDHLFFTNEGWIEACNLKNGDIVYNVNTVSKVVSDNPTINEIIDNNELITNKVENNRGLMQRSFVENAIINACNEEDLPKVESVEFYTPTVTNATSFTERFTCVELATGYVTMYDLQVEKENCYFVDGILVHNCHSLSNQAWQSLLKLIEEPPAKTVIVFCLEENGLVYTKKGMKKIKDITTDDFVWTGDEFRPVSNVFNNGIRDCLKITLSNGEEIKCTGNHKLKVLDGTQEVWKCASDLTTNDVIAVYHSYDEYEESVDLTDTECWFLGYLTGNGHYCKKSMEFFTPKHKLDYVHHKLDICISEGWLGHYEDVRDIGAVTTQIHFPYGTLLKWYDKTGCDYTYTRGTKSIPKCAYKMNKEQLESFVQGWYDADGSSFGKLFLSDIPHPQLYCSSKLMIQELQQLLLAKGYDARLYTSERNNVKLPNGRVHKQTSYCYSLVISHQSGYFKNSILKNWMYEHRLKECTPYIPEAKNLKRDDTQISAVMVNKSQLKDLQGNKWYQNIKSIEPYGKCSVYDLEIPVVHEFIYNGVKVHNCTTDPQKIPNTILSRVQRYDFRKISFNGIINRLKYIIEQENKENANIIPTEEGLEYIAKLADGGMRDAITTLDKCISYNSNLTLENVITALGGVNYDTMFNLVDSTYNYDSKNVITIIEDIYNSGANIKQFIKDFGDFVLDLCKYGLINSFDYIRIPTLYSNKLSAYTGEHYGFFNQLLGEMIKLSNLIKWESSPKSTIESTFILLCQKG